MVIPLMFRNERAPIKPALKKLKLCLLTAYRRSISIFGKGKAPPAGRVDKDHLIPCNRFNPKLTFFTTHS